MAEDTDKEKKVEVKETKDKGSEERPTGRSEGQEIADVVKFWQIADGLYR